MSDEKLREFQYQLYGMDDRVRGDAPIEARHEKRGRK